MVPVAELRTAHTADLDAATLEAVLVLLGDVFDDLDDHDFEHALGGMHALVWEGGELAGHGSVIQRRLLTGGRALGATDAGADFYAARGWQLWQGPTSALTPAGVVRTVEDDGCVHVLPLAVPLDLTSELTCDWRDGDPW
jgi:aminoglycoside 2'-N-acetyltransferase I